MDMAAWRKKSGFELGIACACKIDLWTVLKR